MHHDKETIVENEQVSPFLASDAHDSLVIIPLVRLAPVQDPSFCSISMHVLNLYIIYAGRYQDSPLQVKAIMPIYNWSGITAAWDKTDLVSYSHNEFRS